MLKLNTPLKKGNTMTVNVIEENYNKVKDVAMREGMSLFGVADLKGLESEFRMSPENIYKGLKYGISMGFHLSDRVLESIIDKPTQMYLFHYKRVNMLLMPMHPHGC